MRSTYLPVMAVKARTASVNVSLRNPSGNDAARSRRGILRGGASSTRLAAERSDWTDGRFRSGFSNGVSARYTPYAARNETAKTTNPRQSELRTRA